MLRFPGAIGIGLNSHDGVWIPGAIEFGDSSHTPLPTLILNLMSETLDPRITYTGPAHLYWSKSATLALSAPNEWPLEYQNGKAIGRHAPEPAATNLQPFSRAATLSDYLVKSDDLNLLEDINGAPDGGVIGRIPAACDAYLISQDVDNVTHVPKTRYALTDSWQRLVYPVTTTKRSRIRIRHGQSYDTATPAIWMTQGSDYAHWLVAGDYVMSWFVKAGDDVTFPAGFAQIESGSVSTSPIVNDTAAETTRSAATVLINTKGYKNMAVIYSGSYGEVFQISSNITQLQVVVPVDWGTRYIQRIVLSGG